MLLYQKPALPATSRQVSKNTGKYKQTAPEVQAGAASSKILKSWACQLPENNSCLQFEIPEK